MAQVPAAPLQNGSTRRFSLKVPPHGTRCAVGTSEESVLRQRTPSRTWPTGSNHWAAG